MKGGLILFFHLSVASIHEERRITHQFEKNNIILLQGVLRFELSVVCSAYPRAHGHDSVEERRGFSTNSRQQVCGFIAGGAGCARGVFSGTITAS